MDSNSGGRNDDRSGAVYVISVAAQLAEVHPQTLRIYERKGLLKPDRVKNRRRYSEADIDRCRLIQELTRDMGVNLAGVKMILEMRDSFDALNEEMREVRDHMESLRQQAAREMEELRKSFRNELVPVKRGGLMPLSQTDPFRLRRK